MSALWTAAEAAEATGGRPVGDWSATGVSIDSRTVAAGDLFIALAGPNFDGHEFVAAAIEAGAAAAVVHRLPPDLPAEAPLLVVDDTMAALEALGRAARERGGALIVAVTGSVGKTGTKEMLRLALSAQGTTHATAGSLNNHWGVPLSLARMPREAAFAVFELGMNHPGEIGPLSRLVRPRAALITTVEAAHLAFFASVAEIADAKAEIFEGVEAGGAAVLNRDNPHFARLAKAARGRGLRVLGFGSHIEAEARLLDCALDPTASTVFALIDDEAVAYKLGIPGLHWVMNSLGALLAVSALGGDVAAAARAMAEMSPPKGRGQRLRLELPGGPAELIDESYNASPVSMRAAIATLACAKPSRGSRRVAVLGDMLELGDRSPELHAGLAAPLTEHRIDLVFTSGKDMARLHGALPEAMRGAHADSSEELAPEVWQALRPGDVVVIKGSAGSRMGRVVDFLTERSRQSAASAGDRA